MEENTFRRRKKKNTSGSAFKKKKVVIACAKQKTGNKFGCVATSQLCQKM